MWSLSNAERLVRIALAAGAGVRELFFQPQAQPYVLLFILAALGVPEAIRLLAPLTKGKTE